MEPVQAASDKKQYRFATLANGLECLLIQEPVDEDAPTDDGSDGSDGLGGSDAGSDDDGSDGSGASEGAGGSDGSDDDAAEQPQRAAAAVVVNVGSWADPPSTPGCAHFLEHLLFLGSEKYLRRADKSR